MIKKLRLIVLVRFDKPFDALHNRLCLSAGSFVLNGKKFDYMRSEAIRCSPVDVDYPKEESAQIAVTLSIPDEDYSDDVDISEVVHGVWDEMNFYEPDGVATVSRVLKVEAFDNSTTVMVTYPTVETITMNE